MMFDVDTKLLERAAAVLHGRKALTWLIGGSGSGKTTLSRAVAARTGIPVYDMDKAFFGRFRFDPSRHPATTAWFAAENPLGWMLSLPWPEFDALYRASNAEMLDLLAAELDGRPEEPLLIDGDVTHPSVLVHAIPTARILCLERAEAERAREWETAAGRAEMKAAVLALPDGAAMWSRFLDYDCRMTETIGRESREWGVRLMAWDGTVDQDTVAQRLIGQMDNGA